MYKISYAEIVGDGGNESREREQLAFGHALELLSIAEIKGPGSPEAQAAISYIQKLWNFLIEDLVQPGNVLAEQLRADLISVGLWVIREADQILQDPSKTFTAIIQVNKTIKEGLQ